MQPHHQSGSHSRKFASLSVLIMHAGSVEFVWHVTKILERGQKWNGVPIFPCKIWHGHGMTIKMSNCGIAAFSQDIRTMIEAVHVLDRQAGGIQIGVVRQENGRTQSSMSDMKKKGPMNGY